MKVIVEGDFQITDIETGKSVKAAVGDVFYFPKGANIRFETVDGGVGFYTGLVSGCLSFTPSNFVGL